MHIMNSAWHLLQRVCFFGYLVSALAYKCLMSATLLPPLPCTLGSPEDGPRVVFIVDLWHPNVAGAERQALDFVFAPDL